jgi:hypothetical protein
MRRGAGSVVAGMAMIVVAITIGILETHKATGRADRDFALCGSAIQSLECEVRQRPISVFSVRSSDNGFRNEYELDVQTGKHTTFFLTGLNEAQAADLRGLATMEVRYHAATPVALIAPDGTPIEIPFALSHAFWMRALELVLLGLLGIAVLIWGIVRAARGPRLQQFAY